MMKKYHLFIGIFISAMVITLSFYLKQEVEQTKHVRITPHQKNSGMTAPNGHEVNTSHLNILTNQAQRVTEKKGRPLEVRTLIQYLEEKEKLGLLVGENPADGMVGHDSLINNAFSKGRRSTTNTNRAPGITLINDIYIISLWRHSNPFRAGNDGYDSRLGFDAWTGEYITGISSGGGPRVLHISKETGAGKVGATPKATKYKKRVFDGIEQMELDVIYGRPWNSKPTPEMISPEEAIQVAASQVTDRKYDKSKAPLFVLVDDLYIVTFWKPNIEELADGEATFDTRIGIDATSGKYIAMEIAK